MILATRITVIVEESWKNIHFQSKMAWPPSTYDVISRNHRDWPSLNLTQKAREGWTNSYWNIRCWGKNSEKPQGRGWHSPSLVRSRVYEWNIKSKCMLRQRSFLFEIHNQMMIWEIHMRWLEEKKTTALTKFLSEILPTFWPPSLTSCHAYQPRTQACSRYPSDQRRLGTERDSARRPRRIFPTSLTGDVSRDVTSEIAEDDWERGCMHTYNC